MRLALYQPDIAGNVGTILRLAACLGVPCDIIHPCGFAFSDRALKRSGMDYAARAEVREHNDWAAFEDMASQTQARIILMSSAAASPLPAATFHSNDIILMGSESSGVPAAIHARADARIYIPMRSGFRSLNVSVAAGIALAEGLRQTGQFPAGAHS